jgi:hypothetical protein
LTVISFLERKGQVQEGFQPDKPHSDPLQGNK